MTNSLRTLATGMDAAFYNRMKLGATILAASALLACREPPLAAPVPALASNAPRGHSPALATFHNGEAIVWDVYMRGLSVGRFSLSVSGSRGQTVNGSLRQSKFARNFGRARLSLETTLAVTGLPEKGHEDVSLFGRRKQTAHQYRGSRVSWQRAGQRGRFSAPAPLHSALSALGTVRGAEVPDTVYVATGVDLYEVRLSLPSRETLADRAVVRIDAEAREVGASGVAALISVWLSDDQWRIPVRVHVEIGGAQLVAKQRPQE